MNFVEPIRKTTDIDKIKSLLKTPRNLLLFELWINAALRISDLVKITTGDLYDENHDIKSSFNIREQKTWKTARITITQKVKNTLQEYKKTYPEITKNKNNFIFFNQNTFPLWKDNIWRKQSWKLLSKVCKQVVPQWNFWTHTLRKTFWYQARIQKIPLSIIQHKLNHSSLAMTMKYLWITDDEVEKACNKLNL